VLLQPAAMSWIWPEFWGSGTVIGARESTVIARLARSMSEWPAARA
jgi:hypothetical protein